LGALLLPIEKNIEVRKIAKIVYFPAFGCDFADEKYFLTSVLCQKLPQKNLLSKREARNYISKNR
jgi:hypothetical protein